MAQLEKQRRMDEESAAASKKKMDDVINSQSVKLAKKFKDEDLETAMEKFSDAGMYFDSSRGGGFSSFEPHSLSPLDFTKAIKRTFNITLTPAELAAVVGKFDEDGDSSIHCKSFLTSFVTLSAAKKDNFTKEQLARQRESLEKALEDDERKKEEVRKI